MAITQTCCVSQARGELVVDLSGECKEGDKLCAALEVPVPHFWDCGSIQV